MVASLALLAAQLGWCTNSLNTPAIVAALMVLFSPGLLWDVGFQLSEYVAQTEVLLFEAESGQGLELGGGGVYYPSDRTE